MRGLAVLYTYKNSFLQLPLSGACAGIKINPQEYSVDELRMIVERFAEELFQVGCLGGGATIFQPDINSNSTVMDWICQVYGKFTRKLKFLDVNMLFIS